jgi:hypothetical protein
MWGCHVQFELEKFHGEGNRVLGYTLKLYKVVDGNLQTYISSVVSCQLSVVNGKRAYN